MKRLLFIMIILVLASAASSDLYGPTPYLSFADSPFDGLPFISFHLEDFEDGLLNVPGVSASGTGVVVRPPTWPEWIDSVDADDGWPPDGSGSNGYALYADSGITVTFSDVLPTHAGVVWTDGSNPITFERPLMMEGSRWEPLPAITLVLPAFLTRVGLTRIASTAPAMRAESRRSTS